MLSMIDVDALIDIGVINMDVLIEIGWNFEFCILLLVNIFVAARSN
jgi:hypothetical protein